ncbi:cytochrome [Sesamum alatum]|uniref:Cytochrome n=1 Tax=Sesamum alatum TaxID=300844 RepID=A0AAE2CTX5_9LAMI|nr:cytochrome [Sesamum alatum]
MRTADYFFFRGVDFAQIGSDRSHELKETLHSFVELLATPNLADYFPILKPVDPQGFKRKWMLYFRKVSRILNDIIDERLESESGAGYEPRDDLLEAVLDMSRRNDSELNRNDIIHLFLDLLVAGVDTMSTTIECAMAELIRNPNKMAKARNELQTIIGQKGQVEESDIPKLPYLQAVLKEIFRLHPAGPLLV